MEASAKNQARESGSRERDGEEEVMTMMGLMMEDGERWRRRFGDNGSVSSAWQPDG